MFKIKNLNLIAYIIEATNISKYKCINYGDIKKYNVINIWHNCIVVRNDKYNIDDIKLFNNELFYNAIYLIIADSDFYRYSKLFYQQIIFLLNKDITINSDHIETKILSFIRNKVIDLNIINTIEFTNLLNNADGILDGIPNSNMKISFS